MKNVKYNTRLIKNYIKKKGITIKQFCERCDILYGQYRRIKNNDNVYVDALYKVSKVLEIALDGMFRVDDCDMFNTIENCGLFEGVELYK